MTIQIKIRVVLLEIVVLLILGDQIHDEKQSMNEVFAPEGEMDNANFLSLASEIQYVTWMLVTLILIHYHI